MSFQLHLDPKTGTATLEGLSIDKVDGLSQLLSQLRGEIDILESMSALLTTLEAIGATHTNQLIEARQRIAALQTQIANITPQSIGALSRDDLIAVIQGIATLRQSLVSLTPASIGAASSTELSTVSQQIIALQRSLAGITPASIGAASSTELSTVSQEITALQQGLAGITPASIGAATAAGLTAANQQITNLQQQLANNLPDRHYILWGYGRIIRGASSFFQAGINNSLIYYFSYQISPALLDEVEVSFPLRTGNYSLDIFGLRTANSGIVQFSLNGSQLGANVDRYNATTVQGNLKFNFSVANPGTQSFRTRVVDKNASSTGFFNQLGAIVINPVL